MGPHNHDNNIDYSFIWIYIVWEDSVFIIQSDIRKLFDYSWRYYHKFLDFTHKTIQWKCLDQEYLNFNSRILGLFHNRSNLLLLINGVSIREFL